MLIERLCSLRLQCRNAELNKTILGRGTMSTTATATVQLENNDVRVTYWDFAPGTQTGSHIHEYDYVVIPIVGGTLTVENNEEMLEKDIISGLSYTGEVKTEHNIRNLTNENVSFVEVEVKNT